MNLLLLTPDGLTGSRAVLRGAQARHVISVLRARPGDTLRIGLCGGPQGEGLIRAVGAEQVELDCRFASGLPSRPPVDLLLALPRPKVMKRLWAQLAALGVGRIILTNAARVERNYFDTHVLNPDFFTPLLMEGLQQAQDTWLPEVSIHRQFKPLIEDHLSGLSAAPLRLLADPGTPPDPPFALRAPRALMAVGPEGGWVPFERELLVKHGFVPFSLGPRTLRSDTACIALLSVVQQALGHNRRSDSQREGPDPAAGPVRGNSD